MRYSMLEWYSSPVDSDLTLYYNSNLNRFITEDGGILNTIHDLLEPWQIRYAKEVGRIDGYCVVEARDRKVIEIFFPDDYYEIIGWEIMEYYHMEQLYLYKGAVSDERR